MLIHSCRRNLHSTGFTLMELMVVVAIIVVLASIAYPVYLTIKTNSNKTAALNVMRQLGSAFAAYTAQNNGLLPNEDTAGKDTWESVQLPAADKSWYNALPRQLGLKSVGDFAREGRPADFYTKENLLFLPGAEFQKHKQLRRPYFPIAINTKLFRRSAAGLKPELRLGQIQIPSRTVLFLEQGLPGEPKAHETMTNGDYDGAPKGSPKSFVARYSKRGVIMFADGNAAEVSAKQLLNSTGGIEWSEDAASDSSILWTADPRENPNTPPIP